MYTLSTVHGALERVLNFKKYGFFHFLHRGSWLYTNNGGMIFKICFLTNFWDICIFLYFWTIFLKIKSWKLYKICFACRKMVSGIRLRMVDMKKGLKAFLEKSVKRNSVKWSDIVFLGFFKISTSENVIKWYIRD